MIVYEDIIQTLKPGILCQVFQVASRDQLFALGEDFGKAVLDMADASRLTPVIRIGLCGRPRAGKSTFAQGILNNFPDRQSIQTPRLKQSGQNVWHCPGRGSIRHYDTYYKREFFGLPSYIDNDVSGMTPLFMDIAEHAHLDKHNQDFGFAIYLEEKSNEERDICVLFDPAVSF